MFKYYATFGSGQPNFPGYYEIQVHLDDDGMAYNEAHNAMMEHTGGKFALIYNNLANIHYLDLTHKGTIVCKNNTRKLITP